MVAVPQIGQLLQHHLLRRRLCGLRAAAADLVLPEPRRQQRGLVVQAPTELLLLMVMVLVHPLRLRSATRRLRSRRGCQFRPGRRLQASQHLVEEVVVHAAGRAEVIEGDLAGGGHGLHFPRRGLHPLLVARVYEPGGRLARVTGKLAGWMAKLRKGWWLQLQARETRKNQEHGGLVSPAIYNGGGGYLFYDSTDGWNRMEWMMISCSWL